MAPWDGEVLGPIWTFWRRQKSSLLTGKKFIIYLQEVYEGNDTKRIIKLADHVAWMGQAKNAYKILI
jgi:hypothetical protein